MGTHEIHHSNCRLMDPSRHRSSHGPPHTPRASGMSVSQMPSSLWLLIVVAVERSASQGFVHVAVAIHHNRRRPSASSPPKPSHSRDSGHTQLPPSSVAKSLSCMPMHLCIQKFPIGLTRTPSVHIVHAGRRCNRMSTRRNAVATRNLHPCRTLHADRSQCIQRSKRKSHDPLFTPQASSNTLGRRSCRCRTMHH